MPADPAGAAAQKEASAQTAAQAAAENAKATEAQVAAKAKTEAARAAALDVPDPIVKMPGSLSALPVNVTLEELIKTEGGTQTQLFLLSGRVKADVPPQAGQTTEFRVKSPTASVRGTGFEFDGFNLIVDRGTVQLQTPRGRFRRGGLGQRRGHTAGGSGGSGAGSSA